MPNRRFDWHEHIKDIEGEYRAARRGIDRLIEQVAATPDILTKADPSRASIRNAHKNLEGTYIVRLFAAFEAALRSYYLSRTQDSNRDEVASVLIDTIGGRRGQGISMAVRTGAHEVRQVRNYWAHEDDTHPVLMSIADARARLQTFLSWLPEMW